VHDDREEQPERVDQDVTLAAVDPLTAVVAVRPPLSVVRTDWVSMIAAEGWRSRPSATRTSPRSRSLSRSKVPSFFHCMKYQYTMRHGGRSLGSIRHGHPARVIYSRALTISRR
jgi:hypothetical protein